MHVLVISLDRSEDRRALMRAQLDALGISYEFVSAVDGGKGEHLAFDAYQKNVIEARGSRPLTPGEIGCAASHAAVWRRCVEGAAPVLVMEDDIVLGHRFTDAAAFAETVLARFPFVRLSGTFERPTRMLASSGGLDLVRFKKGPAGTGSYLVAPAAAAALLATLAPLTVPIDEHLDMFWVHGVKSVGIVPFQSWDGDYGSTISNVRWKFRPSGQAKLVREIVRLTHTLRRHVFNWRTFTREIAGGKF